MRCGSVKMVGSSIGDCDFLAKFEGTPLFEAALALERRHLTHRSDALQRRMARRAADIMEDSEWDREREIELAKDALILDLHELEAGQAADVQKVASRLRNPPETAVDIDAFLRST